MSLLGMVTVLTGLLAATPASAHARLAGTNGTRYGTGKPQVVDRQLHQPVSTLPSGAYRVVSADGHTVEGQFRFTVALPPSQEATATAVTLVIIMVRRRRRSAAR